MKEDFSVYLFRFIFIISLKLYDKLLNTVADFYVKDVYKKGKGE